MPHLLRPSYEPSLLTPWETDQEETFLAKYCSELTPPPPSSHPFPPSKRRSANLPQIRKRRAYSTCSHPRRIQGRQNPPPPPPGFNTIHQGGEKRKTERGVLQEISVKNFIIEGGQDNSKGEKNNKKKESTYILKQKFAEFRRSMKGIDHHKEPMNIRIIRYDN